MRTVLSPLRDPQLRTVYLVCALLGSAYGSTLSVLSIYLRARGHSADSIGALAAYYALGIIAASLPVGSLVRRYGPRGVMAVALLGYSAVTFALPRVHGEAAVALARVIDGAFSVGVWVSAETTLLARSKPDEKATVTSLYALALSVGYVVGPLLARSINGSLGMGAAFDVGASVTVLASLVALTLEPLDAGALAATHGAASASASASADASLAEPAREAPPMPFAAVLARVKTSLVAVFVYGYFQSALLLFLPLYLIDERHFTQAQTITLPSFFASGMLFFAPFFGRLGDRRGHLKVLRGVTAAGVATILAFPALRAYPAMIVAVFVAGATLTAVWPLSLALQGVVLPPREYSRGNSMVNAAYAAGLVLGPPLASRVFRSFGGAWLFGHLAALWLVVLLVALLFDRPAGLAPSAPRASALDPRPSGR